MQSLLPTLPRENEKKERARSVGYFVVTLFTVAYARLLPKRSAFYAPTGKPHDSVREFDFFKPFVQVVMQEKKKYYSSINVFQVQQSFVGHFKIPISRYVIVWHSPFGSALGRSIKLWRFT